MSKFVLFNITAPRADYLFDPFTVLDWPTQAQVSLALQLARQNQPVVIYADPAISEMDYCQEGISELKRISVDIHDIKNDTYINNALDRYDVKTSVFYNGVWDSYQHLTCASRNVSCIFLEMSPFVRHRQLIIDPVGVTHFSSLGTFVPSNVELAETKRILADLQETVGAQKRVEEPYILLLLERSDATYFPYDLRYRQFSSVIDDLSRQFPNRRIAVRPHPDDIQKIEGNLPANCFLAVDGSIGDWAKYCNWAIGFNSKAMFMPLLFERPVVALARGLTNFFQRSPVFVDVDRIDDLSEENIAARFRPEVARQFIGHMAVEHHVRILTDKEADMTANRRSSFYRRFLLPEIYGEEREGDGHERGPALAEASTRIRDLERELEAEHTVVRSVESELDSARRQADQAEALLKLKTDQADSLRAELEEKQSELRLSIKTADTLRETIEREKAVLRANEEQALALRTELELTEKNLQLVQEQTESERERSHQDRALLVLRDEQVEALRAELTLAATDLRSAEEQIDTLRAEVSQAKSLLLLHQEQAEALRSELRIKEGSLRLAEGENQAHREEAQQDKALLRLRAKQTEALRIELELKESGLRIAAEHADAQRAHLEQEKSLIRLRDEQIQSLISQVDLKKNELQIANEKFERQRAQAEQDSTKIASLDADIDALNGELVIIRERIKSEEYVNSTLEVDCNRKNIIILDREKENQYLREEIETLNSSININEEHIYALRSEMDIREGYIQSILEEKNAFLARSLDDKALLDAKDEQLGRLRAAAEQAEALLKLRGEHEQSLTEQLEIADSNLRLATERLDAAQARFEDAQIALTLKSLQETRLTRELEELQTLKNDAEDAHRQFHHAVERDLNRNASKKLSAQLLATVASLKERLANERTLAATALRAHFQPLPQVSSGLANRASSRDWAAVTAAGIFDADWYSTLVPGVESSSAFAHYKRVGADAGIPPHPLFDANWVAQRHPDLFKGKPAAVAYATAGQRSLLSPHPLFLPDYYLEQLSRPDDAASDPFGHFLANTHEHAVSPHPLIDFEWLTAQRPELRANADWLRSYAVDRQLFNVSPHPLFDAARYQALYPDVQAAGMHPLVHYLLLGWREGRSPHAYFENDWYLYSNPDVREARQNPLIHFVRTGAKEGRRPNPLFDIETYLALNPDIAAEGGNPFLHFLYYGRQEHRSWTRDPELLRAHQLLAIREHRKPDLHHEIISGTTYSSRTTDSSDLSEATDDLLDETATLPEYEYWLPQAMNDYLADTNRQAEIPKYRYLYFAIENFSDSPVDFLASAEFRTLFSRARLLSLKREATQDQKISASIVIPIYRNMVDTLSCIVSLLDHETKYAYEIIVGDDNSPDVTPEIMESIGGIVHIVRNKKNLGFLGNCNKAAQRASGRHVIFLNNDTLILSGWLDHLVGTLEQDPRIGLVGSKLLNWDGTLQEAGGIFWQDGSAWNFGRNQNPRMPEFNYMKDVDYCSGAAIALPTKLWRELEGFDPHFTPAYCEDSDIAFRVRQKGYRTVYQPFAELIHHEGRSHGRDTSTGIKAYQVANQQKLLDRWRNTLESENYPNGQDVFFARDRSGRMPHILIVDHYVPQWDRDAGSRTMYHYIRLFLDRGFHVTFWPDNQYLDPVYGPQLQAMGVEIVHGRGGPNAFKSWIEEHGRYLNYVLLSRPHISLGYITTAVHGTPAKIIYYGHDLHYKRMETEYSISNDINILVEIDKMKRNEIFICKNVDLFMYPSDEEIETVRSEIGTGTKGVAIPMNVFEQSEIKNFDAAEFSKRDMKSILFIGGFSHSPNVDGVKWFLNDIWPLLRASDPGYRLLIAGSNPPKELHESIDGVQLLGRVSDEELNRLYATVGLAIAPLRFGGGVKGKVIEAFANATPIVTTSIGVQGVPDSERYAWVADTPHDFAAAILDIASSPKAAVRKVKNGLTFVKKKYSVDAASKVLARYIPELKVPSTSAMQKQSNGRVEKSAYSDIS